MGPGVVLRALTYNIHRWRGNDERVDVGRVADIIAASAADIITLNEVLHPLDVAGAAQPALTRLAEHLQMQFVFAPTIPPGPFDQPATAYGNALLSRYPVLAYASHRLTTPADHEPRGLLEARVQLAASRTLTVYGTHLDHKRESVRLAQVQALLLWTSRDRSRPHLLMGDFNTVSPTDYAEDAAGLRELQVHPDLARLVAEGLHVVPRLSKAGYDDCFALAGTGPRATFTTDNELARIDFCFAAGSLTQRVMACQRLDSDLVRLASDHFPLLTTFDTPF